MRMGQFLFNEEMILSHLSFFGPVRPIERQPFRCPRQALPDYLALLTRVVSFVVRSAKSPPPGYVHPLFETVTLTVENLVAVLQSNPPSTLRQVHSLLMALFVHQESEGGDRQSFADPVARAVALLSLHPSGRWREPAQIAPMLTRLTFAIRAVVFAEIIFRTEDDTHSPNLLR